MARDRSRAAYRAATAASQILILSERIRVGKGFNPFPYPGISHGRPLARRGRPEGVEGPGGVPRRRSMVSRLRPGELTIRNLVSKSDFLLFCGLLGDGGAASRRRSSRTSIRGIP